MSELEQIPINEIMCDLFRCEDGKEDICERTGISIDRKYCKSMGHHFRIDCPNYNN